MKYLKLFVVLITLLYTLPAVAQTLPPPELKSGWSRIHIENVGTIDLPPTMEVQGGEYGKYAENMRSSLNIKAPQFVAQQKGRNASKSPSERYSRIIFNTYIKNKGDYETLSFNINEYSKAEIDALDETLRQELSGSVQMGMSAMKLIKWYKLNLKTINGMSCINYSYVRQLDDTPVVFVDKYMFQNNDRMHTLTISYRLTESEYWKNDLTHALDSFRITNIR